MATSQDELRRAAKHEKARQAMMDDFQRQRGELAREGARVGANFTNGRSDDASAAAGPSSSSAAGPSSSPTGPSTAAAAGAPPAGDRFVANNDSIEETLKKSTIGLVSASEFKRVREELEEERAREAARTSRLKEKEKARGKKGKEGKGVKGGKRGGVKLSFAGEEDEEGEEQLAPKRRKVGDGEKDEGGAAARPLKNPSVDTSFLPDRERDQAERTARESLRQEWLAAQERIKREPIAITYSYWDGTGHRRVVHCTKGDSIAQFLEKCRAQFPELRGVSVDALMYVKEDLIIPHHHTFYEFIINKARGKSGPLFNFDVHEDVRMVSDATVEKDESHAGKVVERGWYTRNKHIFPASRWELYEVGKDYGSYTIHDRTKGK